MITIVNDKDHLCLLIKSQGFIINLNHPTKTVELHKTICKNFNHEKTAINDLEDMVQEIWFSEKYREACSKAVEIAIERDYRYAPCPTCIVHEQNWQLISNCNLISN